jgi:2-amino-4-hydroxy-6-hydroxymethyldihydropteridine diphosphokinase
MPPVAIALGSNLGDRQAHLAFALDRLRTVLQNLRISRLYETDAVGVGDRQPRYLNAAVVGETNLGARDLLTRLLTIEAERGRTRPFAGAARTLDLDLILYADEVIDEPGLQVPHPRFRERRFVLEPLAAIAADWVDPVSKRTVGELLSDPASR